MDSYIRGELLLMADNITAPKARAKFCRSCTNLDFTKLEGERVPHVEFNKYMEALRRKGGSYGPRIVGKQIAATLDKLFGTLSDAGSVKDAFLMIPNIYTENNTGSDSGYYSVPILEDNYIKVETTSPLDEDFHVGVGEGFIKFFGKIVTRVEITERPTDNGKGVYVFEYNWRAGLAERSKFQPAN